LSNGSEGGEATFYPIEGMVYSFISLSEMKKSDSSVAARMEKISPIVSSRREAARLEAWRAGQEREARRLANSSYGRG
jgi:hypothetical protein